MFVPFDPSVRVCLIVVTLGTPPRLRACLDALRRHPSRHDFTVALVINADTPDGAQSLPDAHGAGRRTGGGPGAWVYADLVRPGQLKGWARHEATIDRCTLLVGDLLVLLYDGRAESPTHGMTQTVVLSPSGLR